MRQLIYTGLLLLVMVVVRPCQAAVTDTTQNGFSLKLETVLPVKPSDAYRMFTEKIGFWWDSAHTYSGHSANLTLDARPGGCFCERLENRGGVEHLRVIYAQPGAILRMSGALGPLQSMPVTGVMTIEFRETANYGTSVTLTYAVGGSRPGGWGKLAPLVDAVLGEQLKRFSAFVSTPKQ